MNIFTTYNGLLLDEDDLNNYANLMEDTANRINDYIDTLQLDDEIDDVGFGKWKIKKPKIKKLIKSVKSVTKAVKSVKVPKAITRGIRALKKIPVVGGAIAKMENTLKNPLEMAKMIPGVGSAIQMAESMGVMDELKKLGLDKKISGLTAKLKSGQISQTQYNSEMKKVESQVKTVTSKKKSKSFPKSKKTVPKKKTTKKKPKAKLKPVVNKKIDKEISNTQAKGQIAKLTTDFMFGDKGAKAKSITALRQKAGQLGIPPQFIQSPELSKYKGTQFKVGTKTFEIGSDGIYSLENMGKKVKYSSGALKLLVESTYKTKKKTDKKFVGNNKTVQKYNKNTLKYKNALAKLLAI